MSHKSKAHLTLSAIAWKTLLLDACGSPGIEACGVLLGRTDEQGNWLAEEALPLRNTYASPVYFEFDPAELLMVDLAQPGRIIGVYHSHPAGPTAASSTDRQNMRRVNSEQQIPWVWLIVSGPFHQKGASLSYKGAIAYHHYQQTGLQQIPIQQSDDTKSQASQPP